VHAVVDAHDTRSSVVPRAPAGLGVDTTNQLVPSHASTGARSSLLPEEVPTAVQAVADAQETPLSTLSRAPCGVAIDWTDQRVPFQASARSTKEEPEPLVT
jgi:hypothetical protein